MTVHSKIDVAEARRALLAKMLSGDAGTGAAVAAPAPIPPRDPARTIPLTAEQSQLWLHAQMAPDMPLYNESITIHRLGKYDHHALEMALSEIVRRHAIWRTAFHDVDGELQQAIADPMPITLALIDISHLPEGERDAEAVRLATEDARAPIPFDTAPLFRARVVKLGEEEHRLYLTLHHIIFDGVSIYRTLVPELAALVSAFEKGEPSPLAEPTLQYADYAAWQLDQADPSAIAKQVETWRTILAEPLPRLDLAGDRPRAALPTHAGSMEVFLLPDALIEKLKHLARAEGATLYMVLLAAYKAMLFRYTGDEDIIVGGVTDTRRRPELQPLMGYFLNTMALRSRPRGDRPFRQYLAEVKASVIGALGATDVPFDRLIRALDIKRGTGTHPLFNTLFSIEPPVEPFPEGWDLTQMDVTVGAAKYDLYLELDERPEGFAGRFLYSTELFDVATIRRMIGHWTRLLEGVAADPATPLAALPMLDASERETLAATWNDTAQPLPHGSVVQWFAAQAATQPDATALVHDDESWSYAHLANVSDTIAARLVAEGVTPGALVGLALGRSPWMVAAMLGVAKAGAAYLPLDPGFPPSRLALIAEDAKPALVLVEPDTADALPEGAAPLLTLARAWPDTPFAGPAIDSESLAYVLYTSGSTGKPKGVEIPHAALVNLLMGMQQAPGFARGETLLAVTTLSFDIAELELWLPLVSGGTVAIASREAASDMAELIALIERVQPHVLQATPATWRGLIESGWRGAPSLRVLCGGEKLPRALADQLLPRAGEVWNMYGPTETTIWSTVARVEPGSGAIPIGHPIANTMVRVLDSAGNDLPIGAVGELLIGGRGLATGYRGRPDLTDERFVEHRGERLYRTGDLGRWRADGVLECLGRTDNEEKIRGFRVAIEEVEGALAKLPGVSGAAVKAWPDASGERALAGYIVGPGDAHIWRELLSAALPDYMIPTKFVAMDALPLTPNGKVDRNALPEPGVSTSRNTEPPATPEEVRLAAIWCAVLQVEQVARYDDFFDLGGHSLLIARLLRRVQAEYNIRLPMAALFRAPRLADMAELIATGRAAEKASPIVPIQPHGTQRPLLWLDGGSTFLPLSERLGNDQPFLGISVDAILEQAGGCPKKLEDAAVLVAATLREAQPVGPYRIGGWCTSGILAYAVAQEMRAAGDEVELLMLVHAFHPGKARTIGEVRFFLSKFQFHIGQSMAQPKGERLRYFRQRLRGLSDAAALRGGREAVLQPKLRTQLDRAAMKYSAPPYPGEMILFQPSDHPGVLDFVEDWRAVAQGGFAAHVVNGGHRTMLEPPNVDHFADLLRAALDATLVDEAPRRAVG
ncbi:amino acid adenylation domain-containing protein [Sphingomonas sp. AR_OL41]|uniref:non-ribosomal peptide synthetase n=1 Tax=Sphingomonas sp. AR_OL41 TaxID=3042729 RepID=UPI00247FB6DE|nr:amino acid adenylation domain-containing protein [Sphingomonas sp. AR_OL41]MDH7975723.1 amino acid adenylation domain-containing protein [Sphingomonas sp. AR_OL41]